MGNERIKSIDLTQTVSELLDDYSEDVKERLVQAVEAAGKLTLKAVKGRSPVKTGAYKKGWRMKKEKAGVGKDKTSVTIYNATQGSLTHLLENGHQKAGGGRVEGTPHIRPAYEWAQGELERMVREAIEEAGER